MQAFRYLLKPVTEDTLFPLLEELQAMRGQEKPHLLLSLGGETQKLFLSDLLFVESDNHYLTLHTAAGMETFRKICRSSAKNFLPHGRLLVRRGNVLRPHTGVIL